MRIFFTRKKNNKMRKILSYIHIAVFVLLICIPLGAQTNQGALVMEITEATSDNPQIAAQLAMMEGTETNVYFKDGQSLTRINMMGGMVMIDMLSKANGDTDMLFNMMGQKIWVASTKAEQELFAADNENLLADLEVSYDESDTKTIAGFECYKMTASAPANEDFALEAYITDQIKIDASVIRGVDITKFRGFPLEYIINNGTMQMTITASTFSTEVDDSVFEIDTNGYTKMTMEEFMTQMGQMGGMGF